MTGSDPRPRPGAAAPGTVGRDGAPEGSPNARTRAPAPAADPTLLEEVFKGRRSVRRYQPRQVPDSAVEWLIDLARHAPSSMNGQPWEFVIVRDERTRAALAALKNKYCPPSKAAYPADFLREAPVVIVVCVDEARSFGRDVENGVLAAAHIMLGAPALGLGTVYLSAHTGDAPGLREEIRALLAAPAGLAPVSIIPLGYPDDNPPAKALRPVKEMIHLERFRAAP